MTAPQAGAPAAGFGQAWPAHELEPVDACPYCGGHRFALAFSDVQDWAFRTAAGAWGFKDCLDCHSLYLATRPQEAFISKAYGSYYTHDAAPAVALGSRLKTRLRHELWAIHHALPVGPSLELANGLRRLVAGIWPQGARLTDPGFVLSALSELKPGRLLDVGCGNGRYLRYATQLGWDAEGLEPDPAAALAARSQGVKVHQLGFSSLPEIGQDFDCVIASHVLEHAHRPLWVLEQLRARLKPGGVLLLALPNASSPVRFEFGPAWRGLEAPRHIALPDVDWLVRWLTGNNWAVVDRCTTNQPTRPESVVIAAQTSHSTHRVDHKPEGRPGIDIIELLARKL